ncbi:hypothetical protein JW916_11420 [Candidatus Sumerlaeota bacterium]|nr:hypothetical protein [Candidatus Sumerlaeota bacterium]
MKTYRFGVPRFRRAILSGLGLLALLGAFATARESADPTTATADVVEPVEPAAMTAGTDEETAPTPAPLPSEAVKTGATLSTLGSQLEINTQLTPEAVLQGSPVFQRLLGEDPAFIYQPENSIDPMLIPWTRSRVMFDELKAIAEEAIKAKNWTLAETALQRVMTDLAQHPDYVDTAENLLDQVEAMRAEEGEGGARKTQQAKLPRWVQANTVGILYDSYEPMCLVGPYMLRVGDRVPRQLTEVVVSRIEGSTVVYRVQDKDFPVEVNSQEGE